MEYNGIVLLDKPQGPTSHDMIYEIRKIFKTKKVGHTGTLDPMATGVLPVCVGNATKASDMLLCENKEYIAEITFGYSTDTGDVTGNVINKCDYIPTLAILVDALTEFEGESMQIPSMYSAKKVNGKKLYELAREGKNIEREAVPIVIESIECLGVGTAENSFLIRVLCSKGTYIRVLCEDIGKAVGSFACMSALRRISSGNFHIQNAITLSQLAELSENNKLESAIIPTCELFDYPKIKLSAKQSERMKNGVFVSHPDIVEGEMYAVYDSENIFFALARCIDGRLRIKKSFRG